MGIHRSQRGSANHRRRRELPSRGAAGRAPGGRRPVRLLGGPGWRQACLGTRRRRRQAVALVMALSAAGATSYVLLNGYVLAGKVSAAVPLGWRKVSYLGVSLRFPASWRVVDLGKNPRACPRLDVHAVYLGTPGPHPACPAKGLAAKTENVQIARAVPGSPQVLGATRTVTIGGVTARTNPTAAVSHTITDVFPATGVEVDLSYGFHAGLIHRVQSAITVTRGSAQRSGGHALASLPLRAIPSGRVQGIARGRGFDACAAPSYGTMRAWRASPFRSIGVYIGGADRACAQPNLTGWWINKVERAGWHVFPIYVGPQAPCVDAPGNLTFSPASAVAAGKASASDAATVARNLRFPAGTPIIYDMESYSGCGSAVVRFVNAWDRRLHSRHFAAGIYESFGDVSDLIRARGSITEPDVMFYAAWDGQPTTNSSYMPSRMWAHHQRIHQYTGGRNETYGGITINLDRDKLSVSLGGTPLPADPPTKPAAALVQRDGTVRVYGHASPGPLWEHHLSGGRGWATDNLRGRWPSNPAAVVGKDGTVRIYATGTNARVFEKHLTPAGKWSRWWGLGGIWHWGPAAVVGKDGTVRIYTVGGSGHLFEKHLPPGGRWSRWRSRGSTGLHGTPAAVVDHAGAVHVFARGRHGVLREARHVPGHGWHWRNLHGVWRHEAAAVVGADGTVRAYATGTNGRLFEDRLPSGGSWSGWRSIGGSNVTGSPTAVADRGGVRVFARARNGTLRVDQLVPGGSWDWSNLHGHWPYDATAVAGADGTVRVYEITRRGRIYEKHQPAGGDWSRNWWRLAAR